MPRPCSICTHPDRVGIDKALVAGDSIRDLSQRFAVGSDSLLRHQRNHLSKTIDRVAKRREKQQETAVAEVQAQIEQRQEADDLDFYAMLQTIVTGMAKFYRAVDRELTDPDDPNEYDLNIRAEEIVVNYEDEVELDGKTMLRRGKAPLSELLEIARNGNEAREWTVIQTKRADLRSLYLQAHARHLSQVELLAKLKGELDERPVINLVANPEWIFTRSIIVTALDPFPDAAIAVAAALKQGGMS